MKKIAYVIVIIVSLALIPTAVLAGSFTIFGVTVTVPDSYTSCAPANDIVFSGVHPNTVEYELFRWDPATNYMVPLATGTLTADGSVPFPYPSTIAPATTFSITVKVIRPDGSWQKGQAQWTVTCPLPVVDLIKTADPTTLPEPGGPFLFTLTVTNNSSVPVTITQLNDTQSGATDFSNCAALVGITLPVGASTSCTYTVTHTEAGQYDNTADVTVEDSNKNTASDSDNETVMVTDVLPTVDLTKDVTPATLPEPGGAFNYTLTIHNASVEAVTITALTDSNALSAECLALIGTSIPAGGSVSCAYSITQTEAGTYPNTASVTVQDNEGNPASDTDNETVTVTDVLPTVDLTKGVTPETLLVPGGDFNYTLTIHNTSVEAVTITALTDTNALSAECLALIGTSIPAGGTVSCTYSVTHTQVGTYPNTASVTVQDNEGNPASDSDDATVRVIPLYKVYMPIAFRGAPGCGLLSSFGVTVGYEDLPKAGPNDYDYNDWVTDINGILDYTAAPTCGLRRIDLTFTPQARGATYDHAFHMLFSANTFASNGTATLTIFDQNGPLSSVPMPFDASVDNDFTIFPKTSDVYPVMTNTREGTPLIPPGRTAILSIQFDTPLPFVVPNDSLDLPHGERLFFDPYLFVINTSDPVHRGDFRLLSVPVASYLWPEEIRRIDTVYQGVTFIPGTPPTLNFANHWWEMPHNDCVYGDGIVCSLP